MGVCYLYYTVEPMVTESERKLRSAKYAMLHYMYPRKKLTAATEFIIPDKRIVHNIPAAPVRVMISKILSAPARRRSAVRLFNA